MGGFLWYISLCFDLSFSFALALATALALAFVISLALAAAPALTPALAFAAAPPSESLPQSLRTDEEGPHGEEHEATQETVREGSQGIERGWNPND